MPLDFPSNPYTGQIFASSTKTWTYTGYGWKAVSASGAVSTNTVTYVATSGQTIFTTPTYIQGANQVSVFINGVRQYPTDFNETSTTSITLTTAATLNDNVLIQINGYNSSAIPLVSTTIVDDNNTNATRYPLMAQSTSGSLTLVNTASAELTFNPSSNTLSVTNLTANSINIGTQNALDYIITYNLAFG